jgi:hypothetical protein
MRHSLDKADRSPNSCEPAESQAVGASGASPPAISLPKSGGTMPGMGEKFAANPVTGTGSMSVPIATSPGRSGFGWSLSIPSITRNTNKGVPQYNDAAESDVFILSGAEDLVPVLNDDSTRWSQTRDINSVTYCIHRYRPRIERLFAPIERWTNIADSKDIYWRSIPRDNILALYAKAANARIFDPEDPTRIFSWLICETLSD